MSVKKDFRNIIKTSIKESLMPKSPNIRNDQSLLSASYPLLHGTSIFDVIDATAAQA